MNMNRLLLGVATGIFLSPPMAAAQSQSEPAKAPSEREVAMAKSNVEAGAAKGATLLSSGSPNDRAMAGFQRPNVTVTTEKGDTSISAAFSFDLEKSVPKLLSKRQGDDRWVSVSMTKLLLSGSVPIETGSDGPASLFSGDSLIDGAKLKLSISRFSNTLRVPNASRVRAMSSQAYQACIEDQTQAWIDRGGDGSVNPRSKAVSIQNMADSKFFGLIQSAIRGFENSPDGSVEKDIYKNCFVGAGRFSSEQEVVDFYTSYGNSYAEMYYGKNSWMKFYGIDASLGQNKYTYIDRALFEAVDKSKATWEAGAYIGMINPTSTFSWRLRGLYGRSYKLPDEVEICHLPDPQAPEHCVSGPDGPPKSTDTGLVSFETRHLLAINSHIKIALAPQVTYRFEDHVVGVEVPVYLSPDENDKLTGGLKFAYTSDKDEFGVGVFVGVPFSIFFN